MAYTAGYQFDLFLSYARANDEMLYLGGEEIQWVSVFRDQLRKRIQAKLSKKREVKFFMDVTDLQRSVPIKETLRAAVQSSAVIVVILSPAYLASEWCREEIEQFREKLRQTNGPQNRVFVVELDRDMGHGKGRPPGLDNLVGFKFYDPEINGDLSPKERAYETELFRMREEISQVLEELDRGQAASGQPAVYVAECGTDLEVDRNQMVSFIHGLGYRVVPNPWYDRSPTAFRQAALRDLSEARLFVQLIGPHAVRGYPGLADGYEGLQWKLAQETEGLECLRVHFRSRIESVAHIPQSHRDLINRTRASEPPELEAWIRNLLRADESVRPLRSGSSDSERMAVTEDNRSVFIHTTSADLETALSLRDRLWSSGLGYELFVEHDEALRIIAEKDDPDGLLVVFGPNSDPDWVTKSTRMLEQIQVDRSPCQPACGIYLKPGTRIDDLKKRPRQFHTLCGDNGEAEFGKFIRNVLQRRRPL